MNLKNTLMNVPGFRELMQKFEDQDARFNRIEYGNLILARENIDARLRRKKATGERVNVVFVCHRPSVWGSLQSVYEALEADPLFRVTVVAIPNKQQLPKLGLRHERYETEGAEAFWEAYGCIDGYDYETGAWLDLLSLSPDYVFFQQPYNIAKPPAYNSAAVSMYAKLAYVAYFSPIVADDTYVESTPGDFLKDLAFFFTQHADDHAFIEQRYRDIALHRCALYETGCPRYDGILAYRDSACDIWDADRRFRVLWTPRWTTNEGNCHFFDYKDKFIALCAERQDIDFVFRPHPQAFREWRATGQMNEAEQAAFRARFEGGNMHLDESKNYYPLIFSSDCLITDRSTMIIDYLCTGKPIIYCTSSGVHDAVLPEVEKGLYKAGSWEELRRILADLMGGSDPLQSARAAIARDYLKLGSVKAGERIRDILRADALK